MPKIRFFSDGNSPLVFSLGREALEMIFAEWLYMQGWELKAGFTPPCYSHRGKREYAQMAAQLFLEIANGLFPADGQLERLTFFEGTYQDFEFFEIDEE